MLAYIVFSLFHLNAFIRALKCNTQKIYVCSHASRQCGNMHALAHDDHGT
jgi:hypothetical protein